MTPAVLELERANAEFEVVGYDHDAGAKSYGLEASEALGIGAEQVFKTLLARLGDGEHVVAIVPSDHLLDLKALGAAAGSKKAVMADPADAERITGYVVGGISPFGQRKRLRTFLDESAELFDRINVSGGRRGLELVVTPQLVLNVLAAQLADLTTR